jgi:hypothetical protein
MLPSAFVLLDALPLTANGKLDRHKLPRPQAQALAQDAGYSMPRNKVEQVLATIWQEVLHLEHIGTHNNFFDLGGHSLLFSLVQSKIHTVLARELSIIDLFKYPTVHTLARYIMQGAEQDLEPENEPDKANVRQKLARRRRQLRQQQQEAGSHHE